jgi:tRNA pseudouridine13 synthase
LPTEGAAAALEAAAVAGFADIRDGLEHAGLAQERRPLGLKPLGFAWEVEAAGSLLLSFSLPPGAYATSLLREAFALDLGDADESI